VDAAEPRQLEELATDPAYARLRRRADAGPVLFDRIFPADPFAKKE
jgi:hypothetical protein